MSTFDFRFKVKASLQAVADFHRDTRALSRLTPPPIIVRFHRVDPLAEGARADMTMWFGPIPVAWSAVHDQVDPLRGFRDTAVRSPLERWQHRHTFTAIAPHLTEVHEHLEYAHRSGLAGLFSRLLFNPLGLRFLFAYRRWVTRRALESAARTGQ